MRRRPRPTLFPYTTLFRSGHEEQREPGAAEHAAVGGPVDRLVGDGRGRQQGEAMVHRMVVVGAFRQPLRSEEHTSELQSLAYLVCRLLLEKKKSRKPAASM